MGRAVVHTAPAATRVDVTEGLPLRLGDVVITSMGTLAVAYLVTAARWHRDFWPSLICFSVIALGAPVFRALARRWPHLRPFDWAASFWLLPSAIFGHAYFGPIVDAVQPTLVDATLANADLKLFGAHPAVALEHAVPGWLNDLLLVCYYTYFLWPALLGALLYWKRDRRTYDEYALALTVLLSVNFVFYALVPAIGPRFFLANEFEGPLAGWVFTPFLDSLMRTPTFTRDCFPSGHTAVTLLMLTYAFVHVRRMFWLVLPVALGLISATVFGRFHYVIDLMFALPLMLAARSVATALVKVRPRGVVIPAPALPTREPAGA